ncbi:MAG TPA: c-type cytochrome [Gemmatimonadaceae bacterium]|nr:c-type cytochrome [Gemmatimonadaceae bacterium]
MRHRFALLVPLVVALLTVAACTDEGDAPRPIDRAGVAFARSPDGPTLLPVPAESSVEDPALLAAIRRGRAIASATGDSLPAQVGNALRCTSCHLDDGRRAHSMPWVGVYARFPQYRSREGRVLRLEDRINGCLRRSLDGRALPMDDDRLRDMVAYMAFLSRGVGVGGTVAGQGLAPIAPLAGDTLRGHAVYVAECARCHGAAGDGTSQAPPLWGDRSFNVGAGMARLRTAAAFIRRNMPYDRPGTLSDQDAFDVAAYIISRPRPDFAGKEHDWPRGGAPVDAAYATIGGAP